jgi:hypothetical protein
MLHEENETDPNQIKIIPVDHPEINPMEVVPKEILEVNTE